MMQNLDKKKQLQKLRKEIIGFVTVEQWQDVWFFPEYEGVNGYLGTQNIVFLSMNPSTGAFPSWCDKQYYNWLKKYGFTKAHLTDVFKHRSLNWKKLRRDKAILKESTLFLKREFKIINPVFIVFVGMSNRYQIFYKKILKDIGLDRIEYCSIRHYSFRYGSRKDLERRIKKDIKKVKKIYTSLENKRWSK